MDSKTRSHERIAASVTKARTLAAGSSYLVALRLGSARGLKSLFSKREAHLLL